MFGRLQSMKERYEALTEEIADPQVIADQAKWQKLCKEHSQLEEIVEKYDLYLAKQKDVEEAKEILASEKDAELIELAKEQLADAEKDIETLTEELKVLLLPKDPNDDKNVIMEIRAGTGGEEASLFGYDLLRMYMRFAERQKWKVEEIDMNYTDLGGVKECVFMISGKGAYSKLKFESGAHRVQRVPETESQGRIHTSAATVAVLPEAEDVDVELNMNDVKVDTYRAGGAGGQYVNRTDSAVRMTHIPTGIVVTCQDEKSQLKNKEKAIKVLKSRLLDYYQSQANAEYAASRKSQVGSGDRSERIRTYNFPQGRVTDHRINMTLYNLEAFLDGDMMQIIEALRLAEQTALLAGSKE